MSFLPSDVPQLAHQDEQSCMQKLIQLLAPHWGDLPEINALACQFIDIIKKNNTQHMSLESFMAHYHLSTNEGIALLCLAESLLRVPDSKTIDQLISDKLQQGDWESARKNANGFWLSTASWGLLITGKLMPEPDTAPKHLGNTLTQYLKKQSAHAIRPLIKHAMQVVGQQFVLGEDIQHALVTATKKHQHGYRFSFDMLGEAAVCEADAQRYQAAYLSAIETIGAQTNIDFQDSISVKLSALYSQYNLNHWPEVKAILYPRILTLCKAAKTAQIQLTIDAEEAERLEIGLTIFSMLANEPSLEGWDGLGLALQAYQTRSLDALHWLKQLAIDSNRRIRVRLVKGAYWDSEIKHAQVEGHKHYPVFTHKVYTDVSYLACCQFMLDNLDHFHPGFATHNAQTIACIISATQHLKSNTDLFEFQCLHGMGESLYDNLQALYPNQYKIRIYAPVGNHAELLPYLVRRLLENGANSSFVQQIQAAETATLAQHPIVKAIKLEGRPHPQIPLPKDIFEPQRMNSIICDKQDHDDLKTIADNLLTPFQPHFTPAAHHALCSTDPSTGQILAKLAHDNASSIATALDQAETAFLKWQTISTEDRAKRLDLLADLLLEHQAEFFYLISHEAGRTYANIVDEIREAVDFCRYYAAIAREQIADPIQLAGPTGECNTLQYTGRGIVICISPWNFPLAIFIGQIAAALAAGNVVIAKPAEQTPLIAMHALTLMQQAGFDSHSIQILLGDGPSIAEPLIKDKRIQAVLFTGSLDTARRIQHTLFNHHKKLLPLIAETGGQNALVVDSTALLEQATRDVIAATFNSAGQRCSACRILCIQEEIADTLIELIKGAMADLIIGPASQLSTDVGPVIEYEAQQHIENYIRQCQNEGKSIYRTTLPKDCDGGFFVAPTLIEIDNLATLTDEIFGPVLHVYRFKGNELDLLIDDINNLGFGLTFGLHSRINTRIDTITQRINVGNVYINRNTIGATVGVQPFGGRGLSGTGPKAGGPDIVKRLCFEKSISNNTVAIGGNTQLINLAD